MDIDKENTFRALKDQDLIATGRWCKFGFHTWTKWLNGDQFRNFAGRKWLIQRRECIHCNDFQERQKELL